MVGLKHSTSMPRLRPKGGWTKNKSRAKKVGLRIKEVRLRTKML